VPTEAVKKQPPNFDVIIVGAGIVGCAMAREFTLHGAAVLTIEKGTDILAGASKGNSAILHTGFDAPVDSVEHACIVESHQEYLNIREKLNLPLSKTGALVTAWTAQQEEQLQGILQKARLNGVEDVELIGAKSVLKQEPGLSSNVRAAIHVPRESIIDPWTAPYVYMLQALKNGAQLWRSTEVMGGVFEGESWLLNTTRGVVKGDTVINCAGLYGDVLDTRLMQHSEFEIRPRKGQFIVYDKAASSLLNAIILPVPNEITKGVVVCKTIFGNVLVGPTAEEQPGRDDASVNKATLEMLRQKGEEILPGLAGMPITATFAGIRPATQFKDYCIHYERPKNYISVGGIRSTGLTAALGIAKKIYREYENGGHQHAALSNIVYPSVPPIAETEKRDWQCVGNGGIVCHCEWVTKREIELALDGAMPARSLSGLKRRTRVTMGRCQGFYCSARLSEITAGHFENPMALEDDNE
jgi:glycerol-3-phosphate dehydrogenase